jgi:2-polyprenyl-6-methoxyphenol hydroxylase-like FAD-dependent oxidoreductase
VTVSQIQILVERPRSIDRHAAACPPLLAGEGTGLAMTEAYGLAGEVARAKANYPLAFRNYELELRNSIEGKQKSALNFASFFAPRTSRGLWLRDQAIRLLRIRPLAYLLTGRSLKDDFTLPDYESQLLTANC